MTNINNQINNPLKYVHANPAVEIIGKAGERSGKIACRCRKCGRQWSATQDSLLRGKGCPRCRKASGTSFMEQFVFLTFVSVLGEDNVISRDKSAIGMELDIYVPPAFAVEMGGWKWHKDKVHGRDAEKRKRCREKGIHLITVYDCVPEGAVVPDECITYPFDLASEENHVALKKLTANLLAHVSNDWKQKLPNWESIERESLIRVGGRNHQQFIFRLNKVSPTIQVEGEYTRGYTKIACRCAVCGCRWSAIPDSLLKGYGCPDCGRKKTLDATRKTHEQFVFELARVKPEIEVVGEYINALTKIECFCKVCGRTWNVVPDSLLQGTGCPACGRKKTLDAWRKTHEQFILELKQVNSAIEILDEYTGARAKVNCRCAVCENEWMTTPDRMLRGMGCPKCGKKKAAESRCKTHEQFISDLRNVNPTVEVKSRYVKSKEKIACQCMVCGHEWQVRPYNLLSGKGCPKCKPQRTAKTIAKKRQAAAMS